MKNISPQRHRGTEKNRKELGSLCVSVPFMPFRVLWFKLVPGFALHPHKGTPIRYGLKPVRNRMPNFYPREAGAPPQALKDSEFLRAEACERSYAGEGANVKPKPINAT